MIPPLPHQGRRHQAHHPPHTPHPQAGGVRPPQECPPASGHVQRSDQQRRRWRQRFWSGETHRHPQQGSQGGSLQSSLKQPCPPFPRCGGRPWAHPQACELARVSRPGEPRCAKSRLRCARPKAAVCSDNAAGWALPHRGEIHPPWRGRRGCRMEKAIWDPWKFELEPTLPPSGSLAS